MINQVLTEVSKRLSNQVETIKYIDEDWGQLDFYSEQPPVKFPCVLIDLQQASWRNQGVLVQDGTLMINIRVSDLKLSNTNMKAPESQKNKAASIWVLLESIHKALHGWRPADQPTIGVLTRISTRKVKRDDGIREFEVVYSTVCTDSSAVKVQQKTSAVVVVEY